MATTIIFLIISVIALMASVVALVLALQAKKEADEAKKLCEQNAMMIAQVLKDTKIQPAEGWMNLAGGILGGAVRGFLAGGF
jgi:flagellar basal body-associated protein FliL